MPDILTHLLVTHLSVRIPHVFSNKYLQFFYENRFMIYLGAILPDLISKPFQYVSMTLYNLALPLHSPFCVTIICYIIPAFFYIGNKTRTFFILWIFSMFHIFVDNLQKGVNPGYQTFFPFSLKRYGLNIISSDMFLVMLAVLIVLTLFIEIYFKLLKLKQNKNK
jgi:hypothetical protein